MNDNSRQISNDNALSQILAGNCTVTFRNATSGNRYTYKVRQSEKQEGRDQVHFVKLLGGPDNTSDYFYMGTIFNQRDFRLTRKSSLRKDSNPVIVFNYVFSRLVDGRPLPECVEIWHEGRCCRCGRKLTVPESIEAGIGPECAGRVS